jgi:tRNA threonylcarbamoyl adenosine modification protein YeaZ
MALVLAFDTATHVATVAVLRDGDVLGERVTRSNRVLLDAQELLTEAGAETNDLTALVVGIGPGSFTGVRLGLAAARGLALARDLPVAGISTLSALASGAPNSVPVVDAGRREVFTIVDGHPVCRKPADLAFEEGTTCVGDGAVRYRALLEAAGAAPLQVRQGNPAGLTDREVEVLRLIAQGATNKEIAKALVVTEKTAGHHVEHIYAKTGVSTRVGAALFAMRHDLAE